MPAPFRQEGENQLIYSFVIFAFPKTIISYLRIYFSPPTLFYNTFYKTNKTQFTLVAPRPRFPPSLHHSTTGFLELCSRRDGTTQKLPEILNPKDLFWWQWLGFLLPPRASWRWKIPFQMLSVECWEWRLGTPGNKHPSGGGVGGLPKRVREIDCDCV